MVTIIISNYGGGDKFLKDCLSSIKRQTYKNIEVIVVSGSDNVKNICNNYNVGFYFMQNKGLASSYNYGAKFSKGRYLFFMNVDIVLDETCIDNLVKEIEKDDNVFSVDPLQYDRNKNIIHSRSVLKKDNFFNSFIPYTDNIQIKAETVAETLYSSAGAMLVRKNHFIEINGFDDGYFMEWEDIDICWRAFLKGWKCIFVPQAKLTHFVGGCSTDIKFRRIIEWNKGLFRFIIKLMPTRMIFYALIREIMRIFINIARVNFKRSGAIFISILITLLNIFGVIRKRSDLIKEFVIFT